MERRHWYRWPLSAAWNVLLAMLLFTLCRGCFVLANLDIFPFFSWEDIPRLFVPGLIFDLSALLYLNSAYIVLALFPLPFSWKGSVSYRRVTRWTFIVPNVVGILANLCDCAFYPFNGRRIAFSVFEEFGGEENLSGIILTEAVNRWPLVVAFLVFVAALWFLYCDPMSRVWRRTEFRNERRMPAWACYSLSAAILLGSIYPIIGGIRGGFGRQVRPITLSNANQYVRNPSEAATVLNTPFSMMHTASASQFISPEYFIEAERGDMEALFSPLHRYGAESDSSAMKPLNVVVLIMESFAREYSGYLNSDIEGYEGYTPFLDSLMRESLTYKYSFANGHKSIDAMPSVLSGIPSFVEPFFLTEYSLNTISSIAGELSRRGYYSAFFHGAKNGSMGFEAYARASGFKDYFGRSVYAEWVGGDDLKDYDGFWGIWDEPFFQFFAESMSSFKEPFCSGIFSVSSHHPFNVPKQYEGVFPKGELPIHQCIGYSDYALRRFFRKASEYEWYERTLFVITGDHTNQTTLPEYKTDAGDYGVPVIFYYPGGVETVDLKGFVTDVVAQQTDIMPTVLGFLGYDEPFVSFGCDLLHTPADSTFAVFYKGGFYFFLQGDFMLKFDGTKSVGLYKFKEDKLLESNVLGQFPEQENLENRLRSVIQQYMERMRGDSLTVCHSSSVPICGTRID